MFKDWLAEHDLSSIFEILIAWAAVIAFVAIIVLLVLSSPGHPASLYPRVRCWSGLDSFDRIMDLKAPTSISRQGHSGAYCLGLSCGYCQWQDTSGIGWEAYCGAGPAPKIGNLCLVDENPEAFPVFNTNPNWLAICSKPICAPADYRWHSLVDGMIACRSPEGIWVEDLCVARGD